MPGKRTWREDNIEPAIGTEYLIYSPYSKSLYESRVEEWTNWAVLDRYIKEGNVYIREK
jgi:hypothetical protein